MLGDASPLGKGLCQARHCSFMRQGAAIRGGIAGILEHLATAKRHRCEWRTHSVYEDGGTGKRSAGRSLNLFVKCANKYRKRVHWDVKSAINILRQLITELERHERPAYFKPDVP